MTYDEARKFIEASDQYGSKLGLETITELLRRLGNPQDTLKIIHVAGTNGKGSVTAFLSSILAMQGYRIGRYNSPSVFSYEEKIQILEKAVERTETSDKAMLKSEAITKEGIRDAITAIQPMCEAMAREGLPHPTSFEIETAMAMLYLAHEKVDFAVIEVGMGGRLDATNVIKHPICSVITTVSKDHMQFLGTTMEQIAEQKAGIIKKGVPAITCVQNPVVLQVLRRTCATLDTGLTIADASKATHIRFEPMNTFFTYQGREYCIHMLGEYQITNGILAIQTAHALCEKGYLISEEALRDGLEHATWSGRFEMIARDPYFIIDGAHNEDAALKLKKTIELYFGNYRKIFIIGVFADKDYKRILEIMAPLADVIITVTPDNKRALPSSVLADEAKQFTKGTVIDADNISLAIEKAYEQADKENVILAFGSLSILSQIRKSTISYQNRTD